jgi:hypothetical protein
MTISKPKTKEDILGLVIIHMPSAMPLFEAMFTKHKQYMSQGRDTEARAVGIAILESLRACILNSFEEKKPIDSDFAIQKSTLDSSGLEVKSSPSR